MNLRSVPGNNECTNYACKSIRAVMKKKSDVLYIRSNKAIWWGRVGSRGFKTLSIWIQFKFQIHPLVLLALWQEAVLCTPERQGTDWKFPYKTEGRWTYCLCSSPLKRKLRKTRVCIHNECRTPNPTHILNGGELTLSKTKKTMHIFDKFFFHTSSRGNCTRIQLWVTKHTELYSMQKAL